MNKAKVQKNIKNLKKIREIIEISKFDTLHKIQKSAKITDTYFDMALIAKNLLEFVQKEYGIKTSSISTNNVGVLWIFVTPDNGMMKLSNTKFERMLNENYNHETDSVIALGKDATSFAESQKMNLAFSDDESHGHDHSISNLILSLIENKEIGSVKFVLNSPKIKNEPITILPISEFNLKTENEISKVNKKYKFYPSLPSSVKTILDSYIQRLVTGFIRETNYMYLKEKLIRHEESLKNVDQRIDVKKANLNKLERKIETEELIFVSQTARGGNNDR